MNCLCVEHGHKHSPHSQEQAAGFTGTGTAHVGEDVLTAGLPDDDDDDGDGDDDDDDDDDDCIGAYDDDDDDDDDTWLPWGCG